MKTNLSFPAIVRSFILLGIIISTGVIVMGIFRLIFPDAYIAPYNYQKYTSANTYREDVVKECNHQVKHKLYGDIPEAEAREKISSCRAIDNDTLEQDRKKEYNGLVIGERHEGTSMIVNALPWLLTFIGWLVFLRCRRVV